MKESKGNAMKTILGSQKSCDDLTLSNLGLGARSGLMIEQNKIQENSTAVTLAWELPTLV